MTRPETRHDPPVRHAAPEDRTTAQTTATKRGPWLTVPPAADSSRDLGAVRELLALSDERDQQLALRHDYWRYGFRLGYAQGWRVGYDQACAEQEADWRRFADQIVRGRNDPTFAELELRRWGPGGRLSWIIPRPGDDTGSQHG